jgi:hypothetical protein
MYVDDWFIVVAMVLSLINFAFACAAFSYGWGHPISTVTPENRRASLIGQFGYVTVWMVTLCFVRLSIAASLLRFNKELLWRGILYGLMTLQVLISTGFVIMQFVQCKPVSAFWENIPSVKCWPVKPMLIYGWIIAGVYVAMDLTLALMPVRILLQLNRTRTEKILIGCLMATGLLATGIICAKMTTYPRFGKGDPMQESVEPCMYTKVEELVGIIASCLPTLKAPVERLLRSNGFLATRFHNTRPSFVRTTPVDHGSPVVYGHDQDKLPSQVRQEENSVDSYSLEPKSSNTTMDKWKQGDQAV